MRLILTKKQNQKHGLLGGNRGVWFSLHARVDLTPEEQSLVDTYRMGGHTLAVYTHPKFLSEDEVIVKLTPSMLIDGYETPATTSVTRLWELEDNIKDACGIFKKFLVLMESFGGEEIIEYDDAGQIIETETPIS